MESVTMKNYSSGFGGTALRQFRRLIVIGSMLFCSVALAEEASGLRRISEHVWGYVGTQNPSPGGNSFGANTGLVVGRDAVLAVDTLISAKEASRFLADIRKVTDKPVKYVVNTHFHLDHSFGNSRFAKEGAVIIAQSHSRNTFARGRLVLAHPTEAGLTAADLEGTVLQAPNITFPDSLTIDLGGVTAELCYPGPTHTNDSITVYIPEDKVLFVGDILFSRYHPYLAEGDIAHWTKVLAQLERTPAAKIIPGHGPVSTAADLKEMRVYLGQFDALARTLCAGKQADDAPAVAKELLKRLPAQNRNLLPGMVERNLRLRYLAQPGHGG
jgi:cyclase